MAIVMVLIRVKMSSKPLIIRTDSSYSIKCMTEWLEGWRQRGWMKSKGESVKNRDIIEYLALLLDSRERWGQTVTFEHVKGHSGDVGNDGADRLAVQGAWKEEEADWDFKKQMEEFKALFEKQLQEREAKRKSKKPRSHSSVASTSQSSSTSSFSLQGPVTNGTISTPPPETSVDYTHFTSEEDMQNLLSCLIDHPEDDLSD
ncbi:hypothetical protein ONZ45_g19680 [Pleurotus djamor]|nr:hypothetical protein ONZ45_g19680 [Pleurotus djamor]